MGLMDAIRRAEERSRSTMRHGMQRARDEWDDAERRLRRRMRVNWRAGTPSAMQHQEDEAMIAREYEDERRKAIVSVNGKDVSEHSIEESRKAA